MGEPLRCTPLGPSGPRARLDAFVWRGARADLGIWTDRAGERFMVRSRVRRESDGVLRRLRVRSIVEPDAPRELDRTTFELHDDRFIELVPPLADAPARQLVLPAVLERDTPVHPEAVAGATVTLRYVGPTALELDGMRAERMALLLRLDGATPMDQWMVEGVGEVALGPADGPARRWLAAWRAGDSSDLLFATPRG